MGKERIKRHKPAKYQPVELEAGNLVENEEKIRGTVSNIIGMVIIKDVATHVWLF